MRACIGLACLFLQVGSVLACGHCIEDKIAAVYDYASMARAINQKHKLVYFGFASAAALNSELRQQIKTQAQKIRGVDPESVRVSLESASLAISFDPQRITYPELMQSLEMRLQSKKFSLFVLDIVNGNPK